MLLSMVRPMLRPMLPWLLGGGLVGGVYGLWAYRRAVSAQKALPDLEVRNPAELKTAREQKRQQQLRSRRES